jgi:hypothetical protein
MTLILNNEDVKSVLTMEITMEALDKHSRLDSSPPLELSPVKGGE